MGNSHSPSTSAVALALPASRDISHSHSRGVVMPPAGRKKMDALRELKWEQTQFLQVFRRCRVRQAQAIQFINVIAKCLRVRLMSASVAAAVFAVCLCLSAGTAARFYV